jgi:transcription elongation factor GreA
MASSGLSASFIVEDAGDAGSKECGMSSEYRIVLTKPGYEKIEKELDHLRTVERHQVADRIRDAKQFGELAENAEYDDAKNEQAFVEGRITELRRILQNAHLLADEEIPTDVVGIGSIVKVIDLDTDDEWEFTLVGFVESDPDQDKISDESPIGEALYGKKVGDEVTIDIPDGQIRYRIENIRK